MIGVRLLIPFRLLCHFYHGADFFWVIGLPLGYVLANYTALGPFGFWFGLISGLAVGAFTLSFRLRHIQKKNEPASS
ncbi:hypothetical protein MHB50_08580 [Siminovitchia sp. FSL H7-0308]|uniref:Na+-driven multidrug efflux pump n=1 Tax=Siminovitchia thermophila TaxID=1245522 RepID=A0ABS2RB49_9BACI|nr:hypothetical protein [Siminovitchia thermophila]MBM7716379.1 Na+-driven multidrug efflux pump [Siminovitchia thermophila]ONK21988.1 hypothetical protein BLX87_18990 [Bacillus sp. VT-16-64]